MTRAAQRVATCLLAIGGSLGTAVSAMAQSQFSSEPGYQDHTVMVVFAVIFLALMLVLYLIPSIVAFRHQHPNRWAIAVINIAFGGTIIGWLGALVWACNAVHKSSEGTSGGESGLNIFANDVVRVQVDQPAPLNADLEQQLLRVKRLHAEGALDASEYTAMRKTLLDALMRQHATQS